MNKVKLLFSFLLIFVSMSGYTQVTVAPVSIHISDANKNGYLLIRNNSTTSVWEVSIDMKFGYPQSDTAGNTFIFFPDTVTDNDPSAVKWVSFFPRKFLLQPQEEQTVRIVAKPPKELKDGEYWGRPVVSSKALAPFDTTNNPQIGVGISVQFQTVIALNYRKGKTSTEISLTSSDARYEDNKIILSIGLKREGTCAYIGNIIARVFNSNNELVKEQTQEVAVYYTLAKRMEIEIPDLPKGQYNVEIEINTNRDEPGGTIIKGNTITKKIPLSIN